jgi:hypothetical protein
MRCKIALWKMAQFSSNAPELHTRSNCPVKRPLPVPLGLRSRYGSYPPTRPLVFGGGTLTTR